MSELPTVSVLMTVHNTERYVGKAVESILKQTFTDFEFLILDDGSGDRSLSILNRYAQQDTRISVISQPNQGIPKARNTLLHQAKGEFIAVLDSDDIALPHRLARQVEFLRQHPDVMCVGSCYQIIDEAGRLLLSRYGMPETDEAIQTSLLAGYGGIHQPCIMFRRSPAIAVGGYDETMPVCEDLDLWLRLGELGKLVNLSEPLTQYRIHNRSISAQKQHLEQEKSREACERAWARRGIQGTFQATGTWRPGKDRQSRHKYTLKYGWWAFNSRQRFTALLYGTRALGLKPFDQESWRLFVCALIKPLPSGESR
jgi:glycosyltransferase involved in cell wall biosynthesis